MLMFTIGLLVAVMNMLAGVALYHFCGTVFIMGLIGAIAVLTLVTIIIMAYKLGKVFGEKKANKRNKKMVPKEEV